VAIARPGKRAPSADVCLYQIGNDPDAHGWIVDALRERPGVVVLHELVLHHLVAGITIGRGNGRAYMEAMERDYGVPGRLLALGVLDNLLPLIWETQPERFPLTGTVLNLARGLIVHSHYVERGVREARYDGPLWRIPHAAWPGGEKVVPAEGLEGDPLVGCFGHMNMNKRIPELLEAFTLLRRQRPGAKLLLVGEATERFDLDRRLERLGIGGDSLIREGYVSEERFESLMAACDVLVNLRSPTMGETSGSVIRASPSASRCSCPTSAGSRRSPTALPCASRSTTTRWPRSPLPSSSPPTAAPSWVRRHASTCAETTTSVRSPTRTSLRSRRLPAATPQPTRS